jgi:undecaprenyl-diphosphatase
MGAGDVGRRDTLVSDLSYLQAVVIGGLQGVSELFPVSSLGHSVLVPALIGGDWKHLVTESSTPTSEESPYLAFIVALHVATALALLLFYWRDWIAIIGAFFRTLRTRRVTTSTERLAWLIVIATIPVGLTGLLLEHSFRTLFAKPLAAAVFLLINGLVLLAGERLRRRAESRAGIDPHGSAGDLPPDPWHPLGGQAEGQVTGRSAPVIVAARRDLDTLSYREGLLIGAFQTLALLAGISRSGITMVGGLVRGLDHEDAAKFAFLLATPVILAAGVLKLPTLAGPAGANIHGQVLAGALTAGVAAYLSIRFLTRYFTTRTLTPFALYCLAAGAICIARFA